MSKILLIGDVHLGLGFPNNHQKWLNVAKEYFSDFLLPLVKKEMTKDDIIVQLGDLFDNRTFIPIDVLNYAQSTVEEMSKICPVHILVGNHDMFNKSSGEINSVNTFKYMPNVFVYDKSTKIEYMGKSILMMPFIESRKQQSGILKQYSGCYYLFCHSDLNGAKMHLTSVAHKNNDKIDIEDFDGYKNVYSGHIHLLQRNKQFTFVGSVHEMDRNDLGNQKGVFILDVIEESERFIPNNISPKFEKLYLLKGADIDSLDKISAKNYIDVYISNSLLINNRKLRRKLEIILENGSFASVEYIDDINKTEEDKADVELVNESTESESHIPKIQLDYKDIIKDYILSQTYSDKVKTGVLKEYDEVIRIYDEGYKS
jgi:DNA repair exonuclease SbcCD nuclease subunit